MDWRHSMNGTHELGDIGELYGSLSGRLERIVRADVGGPDAVIEDACQFAWSRLLHHRDRVRRETALGWLTRTAVREAFRVTRRRARELPLEDEADNASGASTGRRGPSPADLLEQRQTLSAIRSLPVRQQRVLWLI